MSESRSPSDPLLAAVLAAGVQIALVVAAWGVVSLLVDRDVIPDERVGPIVGPIAVAASAVVVALATRRAQRSRAPWLAALAAAAVALLVMTGVLAVGAAAGHGDPAWLLLAPAAALTAPFIPIASALAGLSVVAGWALGRAARLDPRQPPII